MPSPILNFFASDEINLGSNERFLPRDLDLERRIIKFKTELTGLSPGEVEKFFRQQGAESDEGKAVRFMSEYLLEQFFGKAFGKKLLDEVRYVEGAVGVPHNLKGMSYEFSNSGRTIIFYDENHRRITDISRLVRVRRGSRVEYIVCDPKVNRDPHIAGVVPRFKAAKAIAGPGFWINYLVVLSHDGFGTHASPNSRIYRKNPQYTSNIGAYLSLYPNSLLLIYSSDTQAIERYGREIMSGILRAKPIQIQ